MNRRDGRSLIWVILLITGLVFSCNLPGVEFTDEAGDLRKTVEVLSSAVAGKDAASAPPTAPAAEAVATKTAPPPTDTPEVPPTPIPHNLVPAQPGWVARWFTDTDSSRTSAENRAPGGDQFSKNIYERPFTASDMQFRPDLDIQKAEVSSDTNFIYVTIYLKGLNPQTSALTGRYGVELDTDYDGRGNYLILVTDPAGTDWRMENVNAYADSGRKVGGPRPMNADAPTGYTGYDQTIFSLTNLTDPDAAWGRVSPKGGSIVDVAFKRALIGGKTSFLWSVWADDGVKDPAQFDYNDHFTQADAGSPYKDANYPLKSLALVDSTCREIFNFTPTGDIPGMCVPPATATPIPPTETPVPPPPPQPGRITGLVFADNNNNGSRDAGDNPACPGSISIWYHDGACGGVAVISPVGLGGGCTFSVGNLPAGTYCVSSSGYQLTTPREVTVNVPAGGAASVVFGIYVIP